MKQNARIHHRFLPVLMAASVFAPGLLQAHDLKVCKLSDPSHPVSGSFTFDVQISSTTTAPYHFSHFATLSALVGACSQEIAGDGYGPYLVTELATADTTVTKISSTIVWNRGYWNHPSDNGYLDSNLAARTATVYADGAGTTVVYFTNASTTLPGNQGCTPGYYKQSQHFDSWPTIYIPTGTTATTLGSIFTFTTAESSLSSETLLAALQGGGGSGLAGAETILLRAAVAALLNASISGISYPLTSAAVITQVNAALASPDANVMLSLASTLDAYNNGSGGCPLN